MNLPDDDLGLDFFDVTVLPPLTRRDFFKGVGGGIVVLFLFGELPEAVAADSGGGGAAPAGGFNAYLRIGADGRVACFTGKIEMGQGVHTSLAMQLADELEVPLDTVDMVMGDTALCPYDRGTFGSLTTRFFAPAMRAAAAEARAVLVALAADHLGVPAKRLVVKAGAVVDSADPTKRVTYAALAKGQRITRKLTGKPPLEAPAAQSVVGTPVRRRDALAKVTGRAQYTADVRLPAMAYARILRPPAHDAKLRSVDTAGLAQIPGAQVVRDGDLIAALHSDPEQADAALARIQADFDVPASTLDERTIFDHLVKQAPRGEVAAAGGSLAAGARAAKEVVEATYTNAYVAHAPIEPHAALAAYADGEVVIWASTQTPFRLQAEAAQALGIAEAKVRVITPMVGGGFGGKSANQQAVEAARLSKAARRPVQVAWSRAEEFFYDRFRPAAVVTIRAGLDAAGRLALWDYHVYAAGQRGALHFYDIPHHRTSVHGSGWRGAAVSPHPLHTGAWRAPANNTNTFAREAHIDALAAKAGQDPVAFRLAHLTGDARVKRVLEAAAAKFGWTPRGPRAPAGSGGPGRGADGWRGHGVACGVDAGTVVAAMAEVAVDPATGHVQVLRVVVAQEMGTVINPAGAILQVEGCVTMGLGYALTEEVRFKGGRVLDDNFDTYAIPRLSWTPTIETVLLEVPATAAPQGGGEPAIVIVGALIANAIADATGARLLHLPMTPARVLAGLGRGK